jgi:hypothetical protein
MNTTLPWLAIALCVASCSDDGDQHESVVGNASADGAVADGGRDAGALPAQDAALKPPIMDASPALDAQTDGAPSGDAFSGDAAREDAAVLDATTPDAASSDAAVDDDTLAALVRAKLEQCGVLGAGEHSEPPVRDAYDRCVAACYLGAACPAVHATRCDEPDEDLLSCMKDCNQASFADGFDCGGEKVRYAWVCDTFLDCANGNDEQGCGSFRCDDGQLIASSAVRCSGDRECDDGSDEAGCAPWCAP